MKLKKNLKIMEDDKIYFLPGDVVSLKQDIPNKPIMIVVKKETSIFKNQGVDSQPTLKGIKCRWFTTDGLLQEAIWNTKDLQKVLKSNL